MGLEFQTLNVANALSLMLMGMVGIFVVMVIILGVVVLLNKATDEKAADDGKAKNDNTKNV